MRERRAGEQEEEAVGTPHVGQQAHHAQRERHERRPIAGRQKPAVSSRRSQHRVRACRAAAGAVPARAPHRNELARCQQPQRGEHEARASTRSAQEQVAHDQRTEHRATPSLSDPAGAHPATTNGELAARARAGSALRSLMRQAPNPCVDAARRKLS